MRSPVSQILKNLHERYATLQEGAVADYIPELSKVDPNKFGICIATRDGQVYEGPRKFFSVKVADDFF